ncbi:DUF4097 family beta strand repeat-containing protein [Vagococcus xieshaowenii]|uniref:DUF4097 domain-containing protein n=1 Tax=Vagococcus xieshaowenii TaxID=2562451 RepID=A0A4Z0DDV4_9ENTE|nr:DUF4097 family beta strand repeat-containing protein [Vagococcus xieshaowenii]QCA28966.1 hypothetical protein E4Z98_06410 [Vagococcus xieshaowenii]TFZ43146.1 hypothetical protein E4031_00835 [Vagococcus xieshaowenii]
MKKSTKFMMGIALLSVIIGIIGIGFSLNRFEKTRLRDELSLPTNANTLTIEIKKGSQLDLNITQTSNPTIQLNEDGFIPQDISYELSEIDKKWHLELENHPVEQKDTVIGFYSPSLNSIHIQLPKQVTHLNIVTHEGDHPNIHVSNMSLASLNTNTSSTNLRLNNLKLDEIKTQQLSGTITIDQSTIYKDTNIESNESATYFYHSKFLEKTLIESSEGNSQLFANQFDDVTVLNEKGIISFENNSGNTTLKNEYGDIYLINPKDTSQNKVTNTKGNIFVTLLEGHEAQQTIKIDNPKTDVQAFDTATIVKNNEPAAIQLSTQSGAIQLMQFKIDKDASDKDSHDTYYYLDKTPIDNNRADYLSFDTLYYASDCFVQLP